MNLKLTSTTHVLASVGAAAACMLMACTDEIATIDKNEEYTRAFVKEFGIFDTTHDWNLATRAGVDVNTERPSDIRVVATIGDKQYLLAHYKDVSGSRHISFDIPRGIDRVRVSDDFHSYEVALGAKVDFARSGRAIWEGGDSKVTISRAPFRRLTEEGVMAFKNYLPEGQDNLGKVTQNFTFIANGDFTIYPTYWQTDSYNTIGIYYIDEETNEMVHIPFYSNKIAPIDDTKGNLQYTFEDPDAEDKVPAKTLTLKEGASPMDAAAALGVSQLNPAEYNNRGLTSFLDFTDEDWFVFKRNYLNKMRDYLTSYWYNFTLINNSFDITYFINSGYFDWSNTTTFQIGGIQCEARDATHVDITAISVLPINDWIYPGETKESHPGGDKEVKGWKSRGIDIHIAPGTKFGMYLRVWYMGDPDKDQKPSINNVDVVRLKLDENGQPISDGYRRFYSEAEYNSIVGGSNVFASTYMYDAPTGTYRVLGFEDYGQDVHDLNDMMFFISSDNPAEIPDVEDIDHPKMSWILAVEDLGSTDDFDFNDLVLKIEHVSGETTATVTPLAAGGTLPMRMFYYDTELSGTNNYAHINQFFGVNDHTVMINTGRATGTAESITIEVPEDFSMANLQGVVDSKMGGFHIKVKQSAEGVESNWTDDVIDITAAEAGAVPQILCVPGTWQWPVERISIKLAYPEIGDWILNKETNTDWYLHPVDNKVWKR